MAYGKCPLLSTSKMCTRYGTLQEGSKLNNDCLSVSNWLRCANYDGRSGICPKLGAYSKQCTGPGGGGTYQSGSHLEKFCISGDNWLRCANYK